MTDGKKERLEKFLAELTEQQSDSSSESSHDPRAQASESDLAESALSDATMRIRSDEDGNGSQSSASLGDDPSFHTWSTIGEHSSIRMTEQDRASSVSLADDHTWSTVGGYSFVRMTEQDLDEYCGRSSPLVDKKTLTQG